MFEMPKSKAHGNRWISATIAINQRMPAWWTFVVAPLLCLIFICGANAVRAEQDILLVLDNSGSMKKNDPEFLARNAIQQFIESLSPQMRAGVIIFDQRVTLAVPLTAAEGPSKQLLINSLDAINYRGQLTDSPAAVERAIYELKINGRADAAKYIVFMTDGIVDTGNAAADVEKTKWLREELAVDAADNGIKVLSLAFTQNADFFLIQSLAKKTNGDYFRALTPTDLPEAFAQIQARIAAGEPQVTVEPMPEIAEPEPADEAQAVQLTETTQEQLPQPAIETLTESDGQPGEISASDSDLLAQIPPEDLEALKEISEIEGIPIEQLARELYGPGEEVADSPGVVISRPGEPAVTMEPAELALPEQDPLILLIVAVLGLLALVALVVWMIRRKTNKTDNAGASAQSAVSIPANDAPAAFLHDISGLAQEPLVNLDANTLMIGRVGGTPDEHLKYLVVNVPTVGRRHALIKYKDKAYWLQDSGSVNGTYVNDNRLSGECQLRHGDRVRFHNAEFEFTQPDTADAGETMITEALPGEETLVADATVLGTAAMAGTAAASGILVEETDASGDDEMFGTDGDGAASADGNLTLDGSNDDMLNETAVPEVYPAELADDEPKTPSEDIFDVTGEDAVPAVDADVGEDFSEDQTELNTGGLPDEVDQVLDAQNDGQGDDDMAATAMFDGSADEVPANESTFGGVISEAGEEIDEEFDAEASAFFDDITVGPVSEGSGEPDLTNTDFGGDAETFSVDGSDAHDLDQAALDERLERARALAEAEDGPGDGEAGSPATEQIDVSHLDTMLNMEAPPPEDPNDVTLDDFIETDTFRAPLTQSPAGSSNGQESISLDKFVDTSAIDAVDVQETMVMDEAPDTDPGDPNISPKGDDQDVANRDDDASAFFDDDEDDSDSEAPTERT
ncbi:MAG: VWA domain-containing protein [Gammaproteobacteria bacterium]